MESSSIDKTYFSIINKNIASRFERRMSENFAPRDENDQLFVLVCILIWNISQII